MSSNAKTELERRRKLNPDDESFPYFLEVDSLTDHPVTSHYYPRFGWACLWRHEPDQPASDANPRPAQYIQEQSVPKAAIQIYTDSDRWDTSPLPIHSGERLGTLPDQAYLQGWREGPSRLWDFIETIRDEFYEYGLDELELPIRVLTSRKEDTDPHSPYDEQCEIYFVDSTEDLEYIMWHSQEMFYPDGTPNSHLIQSVIAEFATAYEEPGKFINKWRYRAVQITDDVSLSAVCNS